MMLLGLVIHTGVTYMPHESPVRTVMAKETWIGFFPLINLIHNFRMPVFFVVAGYFGALLFFRKGPAEMLRNRILKILLPMIAGVLIIYPVIYSSIVYTSARLADEPFAWEKAWQSIRTGSFLPFRLSHLWFLYDLMLFSLATCFIGWIFQRATGLQSALHRFASGILARPLARLLLVALLYYVGLLINKEHTLHTNVSFWIDRKLLYCYYLFYLIGWMLYRTNTLDLIRWKPTLQILIGLVLFSFSMYLELGPLFNRSFQILQITNAAVTSLLTFGILGWFLKHCNEYSRTMAYIMEAAYFVYLIHVPIALIVPGLLAETGWPAVVQFLITLGTTIFICFGAYQLFVRKRVIGKFLDGKLFSLRFGKSEKVKTIP